MKTSRVNDGARPWGRRTIIVCAATTIALLIESPAVAQRGRGGGGRLGGGASHSAPSSTRSSSAYSRSPSMSRPTTPSMSRSAPPRAGNLAGNRGAAARPAGGTQRPNQATGSGGRSARSDVSSFLNSSAGGAAAQRASTARSAGANSAVADFFQSNSASPQSFGGGSVASERGDLIQSRTDARSDFRGQRGENRDFASDARQERVQGRGDRQAARVENRGEFRSGLADGRAERRSDFQAELGDTADSIRDQLKNEFDDNHLFEDFWYDHPEAYYHFQQNPVFWTWATFSTAAAFMPSNWSTAAYYDYGSGGNTQYEGDTVSSNGEEIPADEYAQQAEEIASSAPEVENPDELSWLPLGVFALSPDGDPQATPNMFLQIAVSKEGIIAGTYQNKSTGETQTIEGMVDSKSQRAAWTIAGKNTPIMETGIANLTENETRALMHFADGTTQTWLMLHIENPKASPEQ